MVILPRHATAAWDSFQCQGHLVIGRILFQIVDLFMVMVAAATEGSQDGFPLIFPGQGVISSRLLVGQGFIDLVTGGTNGVTNGFDVGQSFTGSFSWGGNWQHFWFGGGGCGALDAGLSIRGGQ